MSFMAPFFSFLYVDKMLTVTGAIDTGICPALCVTPLCSEQWGDASYLVPYSRDVFCSPEPNVTHRQGLVIPSRSPFFAMLFACLFSVTNFCLIGLYCMPSYKCQSLL